MIGIPLLPACPTDSREWHLAPDAQPVNDAGEAIAPMARGVTGTHYQNTLYCRKHGEFINPKGNVCAMCGNGAWPKRLVGGKIKPPPCLKCSEKRAAMIAKMKEMGRPAGAAQ